MWNPFKSKEMEAGVENPIQSSFFKKGKYCVRIIYEDLSYRDYYKKLKQDFTVRIKKHSYIIIPKCIVHGKNPTLSYYYNNPYPIGFKHEKSKISALDLQPKKIVEKMSEDTREHLAKVYIDSQSLDLLLSSNLIKKMYQESGMTVKLLLIIIGVSLLVICIGLLIWAQMTGRIDIRTMFGGSAPKEASKGIFFIISYNISTKLKLWLKSNKNEV